MTVLIPPEFVNVTATGVQLAKRLNRFMSELLDNEIPAEYGQIIHAALNVVEAKTRRRIALRNAAALIDQDYKKRPWATAQALEAAIRRFESTGFKRVLRGDRTANQLEIELVNLLQIRGPTCAERLFYELKKLT
jgi:hypothetical protein